MFDAYIEAWELRELVRRKELRPREIAEFYLSRIERLNPRLGAFMTVAAERALADAARLESANAADAAAMPLYGVAYSLKDLTWTSDIRTTMGSKNFENFRPRADAELAVRLRNAGGILLGKTTTPELGGRPTTEGGLCPPAHNPWNLEFSAGGSSGGAAAQVAAGMGPLAEGTDGGGSIRVPAACCGVVGLKPSRGRISFAPVMGEGWAGFATEGPIARSVRDVALMLDVMAGPALGDPYWAPPPAKPFASAVTDRPKRARPRRPGGARRAGPRLRGFSRDGPHCRAGRRRSGQAPRRLYAHRDHRRHRGGADQESRGDGPGGASRVGGRPAPFRD
jgi:amidase